MRGSKTDFDFNKRYAPDWPEISKFARRLTGGKCVLCDRTASETHHAVYCLSDGTPIAGNEVPGLHIFPLCRGCHEEQHLKTNWRKSRNPALWNHNTPSSWLQLRQGWLYRVGRDKDREIRRKTKSQ